MGLKKEEEEEKFQFIPKQEAIVDITLLVSPVSSLSLVVSETRPAAMLLGAASPFSVFLDVSLTSPNCCYFLVQSNLSS